ncbi:diguanylate cyclase [Pseudobdellovibrio sp. HCB154]|uniref:GGDEF domain-containing protein n=1 Tax=Pseudobdellovibrio sp. HCB154 TaxID=3386277 RepID=UPI003916F039
MNIREYSSQFSVSIFTQDVNLGTQIKHALTQAGYENYYFADVDEQLVRIEDNPPHVVIFDIRGSLMAPHEYIQKTLQASKEIKFIFLAPPEQIAAFKNYKKFNVYSVFNATEQAVDHQVLQSVDNICEIIFRTYQNEQLVEDLQKETQAKQVLQNTLTDERKAPEIRPYQLRIAEYKSATSKEDLLNVFYQQTPTQSWIYLKFVPSIETFICVSYSQVPEDWVEGLSYKVATKDRDNFMSQLFTGALPSNLGNYLKNKFGTDRIKFLPMIIRDKIEGILISTQEISAEVAEDFSLMSLVYTLLVYEAEPKQLDIEDHLTGFYNQLFYSRVLEREVDRSKRGLVPISLVKISIDKFPEFEASLGRDAADQILRSVSEVIKATSRLNDYLCRTGENEFTLILTNCNRKGAAIRSERFRQALHKEKLIRAGVTITASQGISEYPSLTHNAFDLDDSSARALNFISQKGGDKICIYKPPVEHKPDFVVES